MGWAVLLIISFQPLAYVVGNYTCQHGDNKRNKKFHSVTSLLPEVHSTYSIMHLLADRNNNRDHKRNS